MPGSGALSQQWWPLMHNEVGTVGSIDLGYDYELWHSNRYPGGVGSLGHALSGVAIRKWGSEAARETQRLVASFCSRVLFITRMSSWKAWSALPGGAAWRRAWMQAMAQRTGELDALHSARALNAPCRT